VLRLPNVRGLRRPWLLIAFVGVLAAAAVLAVFSLHEAADHSRQAQVKLADVETATQQAAAVPLVALYESPRLARTTLSRSIHRTDDDLASLRKLAPSGELDRIGTSAHVFSADLAQILMVIDSLKMLGLKKVGGLPDPAGIPGFGSIQKRFQREYNTVIDSIHSASRGYRNAASRANVEAYVGSAAAILIAFLGFVAVMRGLARARRESDALAAENARLLAASRVEANTDPLTSLPNRRKLMADLEAATRELHGRSRLQLVLYDLDGFKQYNDSFGHPAGDALLVRLGHRLAQAMAPRGVSYRMGGDEFCVVYRLPEGESDRTVVESGRAALTDHGEGFYVSASYGSVLLPAEASHIEEALRLADQRLYEHKSYSPMRGTSLARNMLRQALTERSSSLGAHLARVAELAKLLAEDLRLPAVEVAEIRLAAELHDIGKVAMPETILAKPDSLTDDEWLLIKQHTLIGERIITAAGSSLHEVGRIVRASHERLDGRGYPDALAGDEIPLGARIIAVCDAFDAMMTKRPYSPALDREEALAELERCAGSQFDPAVVNAFVRLVRAGALERRAA
jgi:diguanylate cyclase (GGDEF)-like protein